MLLQGDVWHSDLLLSGWLLVGSAHAAIAAGPVGLAHDAPQGLSGGVAGQRVRDELERLGQLEAGQALACPGRQRSDEVAIPSVGGRSRSEEHTSELQSLMRNSYAVFCLKKKK